MKNLFLAICLLLGTALLQSCDYAHANVTTLITDNCGVNWKVIHAGEAIPKSVVGACHYKVTIPDYPMQGETKFKGMFAGGVLTEVDIAYDYEIIDPVAFISEAKYLGKANTDGGDSTNSSAFEMAENSVIDKRIKEIVRNLIGNENVINFSPSDFEDKITPKINELLRKLGIKITSVSLVPIYGEQTSEAIDVATANKIYSTNGLSDVGKAIMTARAGAAKIEIKGKE